MMLVTERAVQKKLMLVICQLLKARGCVGDNGTNIPETNGQLPRGVEIRQPEDNIGDEATLKQSQQGPRSQKAGSVCQGALGDSHD